MPSRDTHVLAIVAHELRSPLASLCLSLDMLVNDFDALHPDAALLLAQRARRSARLLQGLTENLTSNARVQAGRVKVRTTTVNLAECIDEALLLVRGLLDVRGHTVRVACRAEVMAARAEREGTIQILVNLLSNATRYSVAGDTIDVHVSKVAQHWCVRVTDHGPGIPPEDQQRIFDAWVRGEASAGGGLGLGLSIVQSLVEEQGGRVGVESAVGHGATFWFTLPTADP